MQPDMCGTCGRACGTNGPQTAPVRHVRDVRHAYTCVRARTHTRAHARTHTPAGAHSRTSRTWRTAAARSPHVDARPPHVPHARGGFTLDDSKKNGGTL
jgi:hypothetical protein